MSLVMQQLHKEHENISLLLNILETELSIFDKGEQPDYDVLAGIADYFTGFPDRCHHPKENLIYEKMRLRNSAIADAVGDLPTAHDHVSDRARHFAAAIQNILNEAELSRDAVTAAIRSFIDDERLHMRMEEQYFFPKAEELLTDEDWAEIDAHATREDDPLFGTAAAGEFESLRENILRWEREHQGEAR